MLTATPPTSARTSARPRASASAAVPTFVVDRQLGASGAHPPEQLLSLLRQGWAQRKPPVGAVLGPDGEACGVDGC